MSGGHPAWAESDKLNVLNGEGNGTMEKGEMARQPKVRIIRGIHKGAFGELVVTLRRNDLNFEIPWRSDMRMEPYLVDMMLDEMGAGEEGTDEDLKCRAAIKKYCLRRMKEYADIFQEPDNYVMLGDLETMAHAFWTGFEAGLKAERIVQAEA